MPRDSFDPRTKSAASGYRPGSWAEVALPPRQTTATDPQTTPHVRLGFTDGSSVNLDSDSRQAAAFREAAARLIDDPE